MPGHSARVAWVLTAQLGDRLLGHRHELPSKRQESVVRHTAEEWRVVAEAVRDRISEAVGASDREHHGFEGMVHGHEEARELWCGRRTKVGQKEGRVEG